VAAELEAFVAGLATPVELGLLGPGRPDLTAVAEAVLGRLGRDVPDWPVVVSTSSTTERTGPVGEVLHGLFVGGTLCEEARIIATEAVGAHACSFVDFGADELTRGRAHPMIDPTLRLEELARVTDDPRTGVILLDVVLGHGAEPDPAARLAPAIETCRQRAIPVVVTCIGTDLDPQRLDQQVERLVGAGAELHFSNAGAARRAVALLAGNGAGR
jgi:FdrA protein